MSVSALQSPAAPSSTAAVPLADREAGYHAFLMLRVAFTVAPIAFGLDKFFNVLTDWPKYLAGWVDNLMPGSAQDFMYAVGWDRDPGRRPRRAAAALRRAAGGGLARRDHLEPRHRPGLLRRRAARLRPPARRADPDPARVRVRPLTTFVVAGAKAVETLRGEGFDGRLVLVGAEPERLRYDRLLIATGAEPRRLNVPGADLDGVLHLRSVADCEALRARLRPGASVAVIGAGWIGSEVAAPRRGCRASTSR